MANENGKKKKLECSTKNKDTSIDILGPDEVCEGFPTEGSKEDSTKVSAFVINATNFEEKVKENLTEIIGKIKATNTQRELILKKGKQILNKHISRAERNEITIPKDANYKVIAATIIYTVCVSSENMPEITMNKLSNRSIVHISRYYRKYFLNLYPRIKFRFSSYPGFKTIRNGISLSFFESIRNTEMKTTELVLDLSENILANFALPDQLTKKHIETLRIMITQYKTMFIEYFSDLADIVRYLIITSKVHKKIGAYLIVKPLVNFLVKNNINLLQKSSTFYRSVIEIFDFLRENSPDFFPTRIYISEVEGNQRIKEYKKIIGNLIKIYAATHIYNGRYCRNGEAKCPECRKENFVINTSISRLNATEFHHSSREKENDFSAKNLYKMFIKNRTNFYFLEDLITLMESEKVEFLCRNHHLGIYHRKYYNYFKYLISWDNIPEKFPQDIFSLSAITIHMLIIISVNNFHKTSNKTKDKKIAIRRQIQKYLKKRNIIEFYGVYCPACGEFNTKEHLHMFIFHHIGKKKIDASKLYHLPCSEIVRILEQEGGGYICCNCHKVIHYKHLHLLDQIYTDIHMVKRILDDYNNVNEKFTLLHSIDSIGNPLKKSVSVSENLIRYLSAIYEMSEAGRDVTTPTLRDYLELKYSWSVLDFFKNNHKIMKQLIQIESGRPNRYSLTNKGKEIVSLIYHFRDYYRSL